MQIGGFRIEVTGVAAGRARSGLELSSAPLRYTDSTETTYLSWLLLDAEPDRAVSAAVAAAVADGSYWVPDSAISRLLVDDHIVAAG